MSEMEERMTLAVESIADSLQKLANPAIPVGGPVDGLLDDALRRHATVRLHQQAGVRGQENSQRRYYRVAELAGAGLTVDGGHHKQWFLEEIYKALGLDPDLIQHEPGIAP
jgi:hypothetical protein